MKKRICRKEKRANIDFTSPFKCYLGVGGLECLDHDCNRGNENSQDREDDYEFSWLVHDQAP